MRLGTRIGVDVGTVRIGIARSDPSGILATPLETLPRDLAGNADVHRIRALVQEYDATEVIVGLPLSLSGAHTASTGDARKFAESLACTLEIPVRLFDERLSTVAAHGVLRGVGRGSRSIKRVIDQAAAVIVLQHALDRERITRLPPGEQVMHKRGM